MGILGDRIKKERENLDLTREELAQKIGVSYSAIAMYEQGNREPNNELVLKLCEIFNCTTDYLMGRSDFKSLSDEKKYIIKSNIDNYTEKLLSIGIKQNDIDELLKVNYKMIDGKNVKEMTDDNISVIKKIHSTYPIDVYNNFADIYSELLTQQNSDLIRKNYNKILALTPNTEILNSTQFYMCPVYGRISAGQPNWAEECIEGRIPIDTNLMNIVNPEECFFLRVNGESMNKIVNNGGYALIRKTDWVEDGEIAVVLVNGDNATLKKFSKQGDLVVLEPMSNDESIKVQIYDKNTPIKILGKYIGKFEMNK